MPIVYDQIMKLESKGETFSYTDKETVLYALGVGFGRDPMDEKELPSFTRAIFRPCRRWRR